MKKEQIESLLSMTYKGKDILKYIEDLEIKSKNEQIYSLKLIGDEVSVTKKSLLSYYDSNSEYLEPYERTMVLRLISYCEKYIENYKKGD